MTTQCYAFPFHLSINRKTSVKYLPYDFSFWYDDLTPGISDMLLRK